MRAGSYLPTQRGTSSASLRAAAPDRRPHTAPDLLSVAYPRSREHDEEPLQRWRIPTRARSNSVDALLRSALPPTLSLMIGGMVLGLVTGVPAGTVSAPRAGPLACPSLPVG